MRLLRSLLIASVAASGCKAPTQSAMRVVIRLEPGLVSRCVQLSATQGNTSRRTPQKMQTEGKTELLVAVAQGSFGDVITLEAEGFADVDCTTPPSPPERSAPIDARFVKGSIPEYVVTIKRVTPSTETGNCGNGLDDDLDGKTDCADPDCVNAPCTTGSLCLTDERCVGGSCGGGVPVACPPPPSPCLAGPGACIPEDGGCSYVPRFGDSCQDTDPCTTPDTCDATGVCTGPQMACDSPPPGTQCRLSAGSCAGGACSYPLSPVGASCDDIDPCTISDQCDSDGGCHGNAVTCTPNECQVFSHCEGAGLCIYDGKAQGTLCAGGVCNGLGGCIPTFPYLVSNFVEADVPTPPGAKVTLACGLTIIDTQASGPPVVTNWCPGQPPFGARDLQQDGGVAALLLSFSDLQISADAGLRIVGPRPVIIAALGSVQVLGSLVVEAGASPCDDGGIGLGGNNDTTCGGGGGGAFGSVGGRGGDGATVAIGTQGLGGSGGPINGVAELIPLRGGCPGGPGGATSSRLANGGGALQVSASNTISLAGLIAAPGQGASGGTQGVKPSGANGAGSGGGILLEAMLVTVGPASSLTANGGGGGEGATLAFQGGSGDAGELALDTPAAGGDTVLNIFGGVGGAGAARTAGAANGAPAAVLSAAAGGGGGGGMGRIRVNAFNVSLSGSAKLSPRPSCGLTDAGCP